MQRVTKKDFEGINRIMDYKKNIWIMNHYATNMFFNKGGRHHWFAKYLLKDKYSPTVFCANTRHNSESIVEIMNGKYEIKTTNGIPYVFVKTTPYKRNGIQRIKNMWFFYKNLFPATREYAKIYGKPDAILASSVHPLTLVAGIKIARKFGIPCICEVRDLWPESLVAYNIIKKNSPIIRLLYAGEKWIYKKADKLIFTMEGGKDYIIEKGWDKQHGGPIDLNKVHHLNNGVDLESFNYNKDQYKLDDDDLNDNTTFKVIYTGSIRLVNQVGIILDVAKYLQDDGHNDIRFLIYGTGDQVDILKRRLKNESINNVYFKRHVNKKYIPYVTSRGDLNIVVGKSRSLHRFGTSANKRFDYFASGKPTLATTTPAYSLIKRYRAGSEVPLTEIESVANEIIRYKNMPKEEYNQYCINALKASKDYDFKVLTEKLLDIINEQ